MGLNFVPRPEGSGKLWFEDVTSEAVPRQGRGRLSFSEGEMSSKMTEGYGAVSQRTLGEGLKNRHKPLY